MRRSEALLVLVLTMLVTQITGHGRNLGAELRVSREEREVIQEKAIADKYEYLDESQKAGLWPIKSLSKCESVNTRDTGSDLEIARAARYVGTVKSGTDCGINMYMDKERREAAEAEKNERKSNHKTKRFKRSYMDNQAEDKDDKMTEDILETLEHLVNDYRKLLKDEKEVDSATRNHRKTNQHKSHPDPQQAPWYSAKNRPYQKMARTVDNAFNGYGIEKIVDEPMVDARIIGGEESHDAKHPWLVAIGKKVKGLSCGGTLVTDQWVVTAAHCFDDMDMPCRYNVRLGSFNWLLNKKAHQVDLEPALIVRHKDFDEKTLVNDIAMVKLSKPVKLSPESHINSVCLPEKRTPEGVTCVATGWGTTHEGDKKIPEKAHEVELPVLPYDKCGFTITKHQLCAGYVQGGKDTCQGDSGGPLVRNYEDRWYLTGVTSFGNGCARANWPGIYTDVSSYRDFIVSVINRY